MHTKNNRVNTDFQIVHFLVGSCHTPDAAYALLCDLREDRENALNQVKASELRQRAKILRAQAKIASVCEAEQLEGEADLAEIEGFRASTERNVAAAQAELATIDKCISIVQPMRRYAHLPDPEAHQAAQSEEWMHELITRATDALTTTGTIPTDQFATMRMHPAFKSHILPALTHVRELVRTGKADELRALDGLRKHFNFDALTLALPYTTPVLPELPKP
jgi:hypothetical protein